MRRLTRQLESGFVTVNTQVPLGVGGEASILSVAEWPRMVAKIYHQPSTERADKLRVMLAHPLAKTLKATGHLDVAWPLDLLVDDSGMVVGFLMPNVSRMKPLAEFFTPVARRAQCPQFTYRYLVRTAYNLATAFESLHAHGLVVGDVNESNVLASDQAMVTIVDTDSFQVRDESTGRIFRCTVGKPDYTAPQLQNTAFTGNDRSAADDHFGLAVLIFQILMEGTHPFAGVWLGEGDTPGLESRISAGQFCWGGRVDVPFRPLPLAPPWELLTEAVRQLTVRTFVEGHRDPAARATASEWKAALREFEFSLRTCGANPHHSYGMHLDGCPWCARTRLLDGRDPFPDLSVHDVADADTDTETDTDNEASRGRAKGAASIRGRKASAARSAKVGGPKAAGAVAPRSSEAGWTPWVLQCLFIGLLLFALGSSNVAMIIMSWIGLVGVQFSAGSGANGPRNGCVGCVWLWVFAIVTFFVLQRH